jgi:hypothetical protein
VDSSQPKPLATWNPTRGIWETETFDLLSEHSEPYSATWPTSGMTHAGRAFELPTPEHPTAGTGSSSSPVLPTPTVVDMGANRTLDEWEDWTTAMRERHGNGNGHGASLAIEALRLFPTPDASLGIRGGKADPARRRAQGHSVTLEDVIRGGPTALQFDAGNE